MARAMRWAVGLALGLAAWPLAGAAQRAGELSCAGVRPQVSQVEGAEAFVYADRGRPLNIHVLRPEAASGPRPAALFFFGGAWRQGHVTQFLGQAQALRDRGYVVALADYRVLCRDGTAPKDAVDDAGKAYGWLVAHAAELGIDRSRVVVGGGSAGGHLALMTALRAPADARPSALILFNPAVDLTGDRILQATGLSETEARTISPALLDPRPLPRALVLHGEDDQLVPIASVRAFCGRMSAAGGDCQLAAYAGQGHGFFNRRTPDPALGASPYQATLDRMLAFLDAADRSQ